MNLPVPEITGELEAALEQFATNAEDLEEMKNRLQVETAAELAALRKPQMKIDTSPFILYPVEAERKLVLLDRACKGEL